METAKSAKLSVKVTETLKEKRVAYKNVQVKLVKNGKMSLFQKCTNETGLLTSADHTDPSCRCPLLFYEL